MARDALAHFRVAGLGGGEIANLKAIGGGSALGEGAFAGAGTTEDQFFHGGKQRVEVNGNPGLEGHTIIVDLDRFPKSTGRGWVAKLAMMAAGKIQADPHPPCIPSNCNNWPARS
jgi:hypothetical protein